MKDTNDRAYFRIQYPVTQTPKFIHKIGTFPVLDMSEGGLSFEVDPEHTFLETENITAKLQLLSGNIENITGKVRKVNGRKISIILKENLPLPRIKEEERILIRQGLLKAE